MRSAFALATIVGIVALAGCASSPPATAPSAAAATTTTVASAEQPQQVCHKEIATGTTVAKTVCRAPMTDAERQDMERQIGQARAAASGFNTGH